MQYLFRSQHNGELEQQAQGLNVAEFLKDSFEYYGTEDQPTLPKFQNTHTQVEVFVNSYGNRLRYRGQSRIHHNTDNYNVHKG